MNKCDCGASSGTPPYEHTSGCPAKPTSDPTDKSAQGVFARSLAAGLIKELPDGTIDLVDPSDELLDEYYKALGHGPVILDQHRLIEGAFSDTWRLRLEAQEATELSLPPVLVKPHCTCRPKGSRRGVHTASCLLSSRQRLRAANPATTINLSHDARPLDKGTTIYICDCGAPRGSSTRDHEPCCAIHLSIPEGNPVTAKSTDSPDSADNVDADETVECTMECTCAHAPDDAPGHKEGCPFYGQVPALAEPETGEDPTKLKFGTRMLRASDSPSKGPRPSHRPTPAMLSDMAGAEAECRCQVHDESEAWDHDEDCHLYAPQTPTAPTTKAARCKNTNARRLDQLVVALTEATRHSPIATVFSVCLATLARYLDIEPNECEGLAIDLESWIATYLRPDAENDTIPFASLGDSLAPHFKAHEAPYLVGELLRLVSRRYGLSTSEVSDVCDAWVRKHEDIAEVPSSQTEGVRAELEKRLCALANLSSASDALHACLDVVVTRCGNTPDSLTAVVDAWLDAHAPQRYGEPKTATTEAKLARAFDELRKIAPTQIPVLFKGTGVSLPISDDLVNYPLTLVFGAPLTNPPKDRSAHPTYAIEILKGRNPGASSVLYDPSRPLSLDDTASEPEEPTAKPVADPSVRSGEQLAAIHAEAQETIRAAVQRYADGVLELCKATGMRAMSIEITPGVPTIELGRDTYGLLPVSILSAYIAGKPGLSTSLLAALPELPECGAKVTWPLG